MVDNDRIRINGIEVRERIIGEGTPVLMVHGWGANINLLEPLASRLSLLGYQCLMFDLPGFGESEEPANAFTIFDYAKFCLAVLEHHGLPSAYFFGHSLGGRIGLILAAEYPARIDKMVLSNSAGIKVEPAFFIRARLKLYQSLRDSLDALGAGAVAERLRQLYNQRYGSSDFQSATPLMRQTLINVINQDLLEYAERVDVPTILIWGDVDQDTPLWMGKKLEQAIPDAALIVFESASHYAYLDFPEKTAAVMDALYRST